MTALVWVAWTACRDPSARPDSPPPSAEPWVGRVAARRLNRSEYDRTVRDLLGTALSPAASFPGDPLASGFDNQAVALSVSPVQLELYDSAALALTTELFGPVEAPFHHEWDIIEDVHAPGAPASGLAPVLRGEAEFWYDYAVPRPGDYRLTVVAADQGQSSFIPALLLYVDHVEVDRLQLPDVNEFTTHTFAVTLPAAQGTVGFGLEYAVPENGLVIEQLWVDGPEPVRSPAYPSLLPCAASLEPDDAVEGAVCARQVVEALAPRAFRRPVDEATVQALLEVYRAGVEQGLNWDQAMRDVVHSLLLWPQFLFRIEPEPEPGAARALDGHEVASRLSYFLWSSMPDEELTAAAASGELLEPAALEAQVARMLADPRASALVDDLGGQWLGLRATADIAPVVSLFPSWDEELRLGLASELEARLRDVLLDGRPMTELVVGTEALLDAEAAAHYGLDPSSLSVPRRVDTAELGRLGVLGSGGLQAVLAHPDRTSPAQRGKWILDTLLCDTPPPPPPGVEAGLSDSALAGGDLRAQLEAHAQDPACRGCHTLFDPLGFALEGFDAVGAPRSTYRDGAPIDTTGTLPDGTSLEGPRDLATWLASDPRLPRCMVEKVFTYAMGRAPHDGDLQALGAIEARFVESGWQFGELAAAIATSETFLTVEAP
jgi:hypothetical protein